MGYQLAAALVVAVHYAYVVFTLVGGFLAWRWPRVLRFHLAAVGIAAVLAVTDMECPLTEVEKGFLRLAGDTPYESGFISHYLIEPVHPAGTTPTLRVVLRVGVTTLTALAYLGYLVRRRATPEARRPAPARRLLPKR